MQVELKLSYDCPEFNAVTPVTSTNSWVPFYRLFCGLDHYIFGIILLLESHSVSKFGQILVTWAVHFLIHPVKVFLRPVTRTFH